MSVKFKSSQLNFEAHSQFAWMQLLEEEISLNTIVKKGLASNTSTSLKLHKGHPISFAIQIFVLEHLVKQK